MPKLLEDAIGAKFDVVPGYVAGQDIDLAVERGEVMCRAFTVNAFFAREPFITWRKKNFVRVLYQTGSKRDARIKDVPLFNELMDKYKTAENVRRLVKVVVAATDAVDGRVPVTCLPRSATRFSIGRNRVHCSATDTSANAATVSFKVTVRQHR